MNDEIIRQRWTWIKEHIREEYRLSNISYKTWIEGLEIAEIADHTVYIRIPSDKPIMLDYIVNNYRVFFQITITEMLDENPEIAEGELTGGEEPRSAGLPVGKPLCLAVGALHGPVGPEPGLRQYQRPPDARRRSGIWPVRVPDLQQQFGHLPCGYDQEHDLLPHVR